MKLIVLSLVIFSSMLSAQSLSNLDIDRTSHKKLNLTDIKSNNKEYNQIKTYNKLNMSEKEAAPFIEFMIIRSMLKNIEVKDTVDMLTKIKETGVRDFLKSVCYVGENLWCYLGIQDKKDIKRELKLKDLTKTTVEESLWFLELLFDRYNDNIENNQGSTVKENFSKWDPKYGPILLSLFEGNYIDFTQTAKEYQEKIKQ